MQSAFFADTQVSLHTGYAWTKEEQFGFCSLSNSGDHKAEAVHAALQPIVEYFATRGVRKLWVCSDSPISQYRNSKNCWLLQLTARQFNIDIDWVWTEAGHGKSPCDGIGGIVASF